jgi:hypothetical protein
MSMLEQLAELPALGDGRAGVPAMFQRVGVAFWRTGSSRSAVHAASLFATHSGRTARFPCTGSRTAARARQHRPGVTGMIASHRRVPLRAVTGV